MHIRMLHCSRDRLSFRREEMTSYLTQMRGIPDSIARKHKTRSTKNKKQKNEKAKGSETHVEASRDGADGVERRTR